MNRTFSQIVLLAMTTGCVSSLTGNEGNFVFSYVADDDVTNFNKPVAVGASLDIDVRQVGTNTPVDLLSAAFDDEAVLTVSTFGGYQLTAQGTGDGTALLEGEATTQDGETLTDSINMLASTPEVLKLSHTCSTDDVAAYLTDSRVWVPFEMEMSNTQPVIGYGYYPLTVSGSGASLDSADSGQQYMAFDTASTGTVTLDSDIDDTQLTMVVADLSEVDGVEEPIPFVLEDIDVGDTNAFYVRGLVGDAVVCQADMTKTVVSDTPDICDVRDKDAGEDTSDTKYEYGWFEIEGVAEGTCLYTVTFTGGGASAQFEYPIEP